MTLNWSSIPQVALLVLIEGPTIASLMQQNWRELRYAQRDERHLSTTKSVQPPVIPHQLSHYAQG